MKSKEDILKQLYITASDLKILIPTLGKNKCIDYIKEIQKEMIEEGIFVPNSKPLLASTKVFRKKFKI